MRFSRQEYGNGLPLPSPVICWWTHCCVLLFVTLDCSMPRFSILYHLLELAQLVPIESGMPSNYLASRGQSVGASALASALPMNIQGWFPLGWTGWISLQSKEISRAFSNTAVQKHQFFGPQPYLWSNSLYTTTGKTIALTIWTFVGKVMSLIFNMQSRLVIAFLPRSKHLLISWLQSPSTVILEPKKINMPLFPCFPSICHEVMGPDAMI